MLHSFLEETIIPQLLQTATVKGSDTLNNLSLNIAEFPCEICASLSISPNLRPPSLALFYTNSSRHFFLESSSQNFTHVKIVQSYKDYTLAFFRMGIDCTLSYHQSMIALQANHHPVVAHVPMTKSYQVLGTCSGLPIYLSDYNHTIKFSLMPLLISLVAWY